MPGATGPTGPIRYWNEAEALDLDLRGGHRRVPRRVAAAARRQDRTLTVTGPAGENIITVADGEVFISRADCPDQICVQHGPLQKTGGPIICLPNRLTIEWAQKDAQVDALSGTGGLS